MLSIYSWRAIIISGYTVNKVIYYYYYLTYYYLYEVHKANKDTNRSTLIHLKHSEAEELVGHSCNKAHHVMNSAHHAQNPIQCLIH